MRTAPTVKDLENSITGLVSEHWSENLLLLANFSGLPSITIPNGIVGDKKMPSGICINGRQGSDLEVIKLSKKIVRKK
jgi:Asp-tRNA(Asn)/Glu-tRNA(Gln) amidotransferase A subunit family amidase